VVRALERLVRREPELAARLRAAIYRYAATGHGGVTKLQGRSDYRLRVGAWRVVFDLDQARRLVIVGAIGPRKDIYRD